MTLSALFKENKSRLTKGRLVSLCEGLVKLYQRTNFVGARIHTVFEKAVQILTKDGHYVTIHERDPRKQHAWTLDQFTIE